LAYLLLAAGIIGTGLLAVLSNADIMGPYTNKKISSILGWTVIFAMTLLGLC